MKKWYELAGELLPNLDRCEINTCIEAVSNEIKNNGETPFSLVLESEFTNDPNEIAKIIREFQETCHNKGTFKAMYSETNGFDINWDRWYFNLFGYSKVEDNDYDWLCYYDTESDEYDLTGMEALQKIYEKYEGPNNPYEEEFYMSSLLVVFKFQRLMQKAIDTSDVLTVPFYVTGHEYDFFAVFNSKT